MAYGLIGSKLGHSYSKIIHEMLCGYRYDLCPLPTEEEVRAFMTRRQFRAINVTIPYKLVVMEYCSYIDPHAKAINAVNTIVNRNGLLYGYNTDYPGFSYLCDAHGVEFKDRTVLILGTGGTHNTTWAVAHDRGAKQIYTVSRHPDPEKGELTYAQALTTGAQIIINTTPVGMYPKENAAPLHYLPHKTEYVFDAIYNPPVTSTMKLANPRKTKTRDGLFMLVMQAAHAQTIWTGVTFEPQACETILRRTYGKMAVKRLHEKHGKKNLVLCGFMGSGKTTIGRKLARLTGLEFIDADIYLEAKEGKKISEIFAEKGETYFRDRETAYIKELAQKDGIVLALGGGSVLRPENVAAVKEPGLLILLDTPFYRIMKNLSYSTNRPLLDKPDKQAETRRLYNARKVLYHRVADIAGRSPRLSGVLEKVVKSV